MEKASDLPGAGNAYLYSARISASRPAEHYTPRVVPYFDGAAVPLGGIADSVVRAGTVSLASLPLRNQGKDNDNKERIIWMNCRSVSSGGYSR